MIDIDWTLFLQFANFVILLLILNALLFKPLLRIMDERARTIESGHDKARSLDEQIQAKMASYREKLQQAKTRAAEERGALRAAAIEEESRIVGEAQKKAAEQLAGMRARVSAEVESARAALRGDAHQLAREVASKVLGRSV